MDLMARAPSVSLAKLQLFAMAAVATRRVFALYDPSQSRDADGKWGPGGFGGPKTTTGRKKGSLVRRVRVERRRAEIAPHKARFEKARAEHQAAPSKKTASRLESARERLSQARQEAAGAHRNALLDAPVKPSSRRGDATSRKEDAAKVKPEYERAKAEHAKHGNKETAQRLEVAHARLNEARSGRKSVDSSTWGERANFDDMVKSGRLGEDDSLHAESLIRRHLKNGDTIGARKVAREHSRHRTSVNAIHDHFASGNSKASVRDEVDVELNNTRQMLKDYAQGKAGRVLAEHEYRLAKAEAYARLEAVAQTRKQRRGKHA